MTPALSLTWPIVLAVLCGAALHASWNALVKSAGDKTVDNALVHFLGAWVALPLLLWVGLPRPEAAPYSAASLVIHIGYYIALAGAYEHGELGMTYPIMRGFAPLLVALSSSALIGETPTAAAWIGTVAITVGVALVGWLIRVRHCTTARRWPSLLPTPPSLPSTPWSTAWVCAPRWPPGAARCAT